MLPTLHLVYSLTPSCARFLPDSTPEGSLGARGRVSTSLYHQHPAQYLSESRDSIKACCIRGWMVFGQHVHKHSFYFYFDWGLTVHIQNPIPKWWGNFLAFKTTQAQMSQSAEKAEAKSWFKADILGANIDIQQRPLPLPKFLFVCVMSEWGEEMKKLTAWPQYWRLLLHNWHSFIALLFFNHIWSLFQD